MAVTGLVGAGCSLAVALRADGVSGVQIALLQWISVPYVAAGLVAWWRRPASRLGPLMIAGGFASGLSSLQVVSSDLPYTVGSLFDILPAALFLHVYLAFPDGHLRSRFERAVVAAAYVAAVGLQLVKMSLGSAGAGDLLTLWSRPDVAQTVERAQLLSLSALCLAGIGVLARRRREAGRPLRRSVAVMLDLFAVCLVMLAVLFVMGAFEAPGFRRVQQTTLFVVGLSPLAFLIGLLDARLARSAVADLMVELGRDRSAPDLRSALARALGDPSLTLAYWLPDFDRYADQHGRPVDVPGRGRGATTVVDRDGAPVAVLLHDRALDDDPELLHAVGAAAAITLENGRLQAELQARVEELRQSRARVIEAGQRERRRLERNLHDGAQQRLVALSLELGMLEAQMGDDPAARTRLRLARREISTSLQELRDLARGLHPAVLSGHGLAVALEALAVRAAVPVRLEVDVPDRLPEQVEVAAFYVASESLANVDKHACGTTAGVSVVRTGNRLVVEIVDDGIGGVDDGGSGVRGLRDRVEALGGRLGVRSPSAGGTVVRAELPCG